MRMTDKSNLLFIFGHYRGIVIKNYIKGNTTSSLRFVERWNSPDIQNGRLVLVNKLQPCLIPTATKTPYWKPFEVMLMCVAFPEQVLAKLGWVIYSASSRLGRSPPRFTISSDSQVKEVKCPLFVYSPATVVLLSLIILAASFTGAHLFCLGAHKKVPSSASFPFLPLQTAPSTRINHLN